MTADDRVDVEGLITSADNLKGQLRRAAEGGYTVGRTKGFCEDAAQMLSRLTTRLSALLDEVEGLTLLRDAGGVDDSLTPTLADLRRATEAAHREAARATRAEGLVEVAREGFRRIMEMVAMKSITHQQFRMRCDEIAQRYLAKLSTPNQADVK